MTIPAELEAYLREAAAAHMEVNKDESVAERGARLEQVRETLRKQIDAWYERNPNTDFTFDGEYYPSLTVRAPNSSPRVKTRKVQVGFLEDCRQAVIEGHAAMRDARRYCMSNHVQTPFWLTESREVPVTAEDYQRFISRHCTLTVNTSADHMTHRDFAILTSLHLRVSPFPSKFLQRHQPY